MEYVEVDTARSTNVVAGAACAAPGKSTDGNLIYAIGDVHGRYDLLKAALLAITEDAKVHAHGRAPRIVFCGDYIDRGTESAKVIQTLLWLHRRRDFGLTLLKGNHEQAMMAFLNDPNLGSEWLDFGGAETLQSYGINLKSPYKSRNQLSALRDSFLDELPVSHLSLITELELLAVFGDYVFVHAGIRPGVQLKDQVEEDLLWIRAPFLDSEETFSKIVVHGHTWISDVPDIRSNRIGLDTGAYATGALSVVRLDGASMQLFQVRRDPSF